MNRWKGNK